MIDPLKRWREYGEKPDYAGLLSFGGLPYTEDPDTPYELSSDGGPSDQARRWSSDRFHGNHASGFSGPWPPASAQAVKYAVSQVRGLSPHNASVCNSENSIAASRPLQTAPEP